MRYGNPSKKAKTIPSTRGHVLNFPGRIALADGKLPKGIVLPEGATADTDGVIYIYVPPQLRGEVAMHGMQPESEIPEGDEIKVAAKPEDPEVLRKSANDAFDLLVEAAERESFGANGVPKAQAVEKLLGYPLTNGELKDLWGRYMIDKKAD